jgi:hypothetical protein
MYAARAAIVSVLLGWRAAVCAAQPTVDEPPKFAGDPLMRAPQTESWEVGSSLDLERRTTARSGSDDAPAHGSYDRTTLTITASHQLGVGLVELQLPISTIRFREPASSTAADVGGLGDASLHFHRERHGRRWSSRYFVGLRLPTGATAAMPVVGEALPTVVQLGAGTFDPEFGACTELALGEATALAACDHGRIALYANGHGFRDGYAFHARLLLTTAFAERRASAHIGVLYETTSAAELDGHDLASTGHHELFAEASLWFVVVRGLSLRSTVELPLYEHVSGMQLADTVRVMAGVSYDFAR